MHHLRPLDTISELLSARARGDVETALSCYSPDATVVREPGKTGRGEAAIRGFIEATIALPISFDHHAILEAGAVALHLARWRLTPVGGSETSGQTADVLTRQPDGSWLIVIDNPWGTSLLDHLSVP